MIFVIYLIDSAQNQYMLHQFQQTDHDKSFLNLSWTPLLMESSLLIQKA